LIKRLSVLVEGYIILPEHIEKYGELDSAAMPTNPLQALGSLVEMQIRHQNEARALILKTYQACEQNLSETARKLEVPRTSLRSQCQALGIWENMDTVTTVDANEDRNDLKRRVDRSIRSLIGRIVAPS
jgi:DNA-binding NtrC family response regulator